MGSGTALALRVTGLGAIKLGAKKLELLICGCPSVIFVFQFQTGSDFVVKGGGDTEYCWWCMVMMVMVELEDGGGGGGGRMHGDAVGDTDSGDGGCLVLMVTNNAMIH